MTLIINDEWQNVIEAVRSGTDHIFVTGGAGTGKSSLLQHLIATLDMDSMVTVAPTGVAALRVGGETIHRFFRFPAHALDSDDIERVSRHYRDKYELLTRNGLLIIDEVSMVRADMMDAIDAFLRLNGHDSTRPFGGARLLMFGDLYQLPPVSKDKDEKRYLVGRYGTDTPYFFHAEVWRTASLKVHTLSTIYRQSDPVFTDALNAIRRGNATTDHLSIINSRVDRAFIAPKDKVWLTLATTNAVADVVNEQMLMALRTLPKVFEGEITGEFDKRNMPTDETLVLRIGATVITVYNAPDGGYRNGSIGKVVELDPLTLDIDGSLVEVSAATWDQIQYEYDPRTKRLAKRVIGQFTQVPIKLAAAITIQRSQGLTSDNVIVDLSTHVFASGMAYVALSRCRTLDGMVLRRALRLDDLRVSPQVRRFEQGDLAPLAIEQGRLF